MSTIAFYREQAGLRQAEADAATLGNVKTRSQAAADAWVKLAERIEQTDTLREQRLPPATMQEVAAERAEQAGSTHADD